MNRELKFRVWDYQRNRWAKESEARESMGFEFGVNDYYDNIAGEKMKRWDFQQFTGLTDKNGKDIYEGDILSDYTETDEGVKKSFCQVFWNKEKGSWHLDMSTTQNRSYSYPLYSELKDSIFISVSIYFGKIIILSASSLFIFTSRQFLDSARLLNSEIVLFSQLSKLVESIGLKSNSTLFNSIIFDVFLLFKNP